MNKKNYNALNVFMNGKLVGKLKRYFNGGVGFLYVEEWLNNNLAIPISLSIPLIHKEFIGDEVLNVFENLLPDNVNVRKTIAEKNRTGEDPYSLLSVIGKDCVGALQLLPETIETTDIKKINARLITDKDIAAKIKNLYYNPLGTDIEQDFRISLAGYQEKTAFLFYKNKWYEPYDTTPTTHIFKPPIGITNTGKNKADLSDSVENEYFCMQLSSALGLKTANTSIQQFDDVKVLVVERFDRKWINDDYLLRLPQEDFCQVFSLPSALKYESHANQKSKNSGVGIIKIMNFLQESTNPIDRKNFFKAQILFWLMAATDGHTKNFSIFLSNRGSFSLTPLYDILSMQPYIDKKQISSNHKFSMAVGNSRHYDLDKIFPRHFNETASKVNFSREGYIIWEELKDTMQAAIEKVYQILPHTFPQYIVESITKGIKNRLFQEE